jgi:hypothetical protein
MVNKRKSAKPKKSAIEVVGHPEGIPPEGGWPGPEPALSSIGDQLDQVIERLPRLRANGVTYAKIGELELHITAPDPGPPAEPERGNFLDPDTWRRKPEPGDEGTD